LTVSSAFVFPLRHCTVPGMLWQCCS